MKFLLFTLAICIFKCVNSNFVCPIDSDQKPIDGAYRDPNICGVYYHCVDGMAFPQQCPPGLHFQLSATPCHFFACVQASQSDCSLTKSPLNKKEDITTGMKDSSLLKSLIQMKVLQTRADECQPNLNSTVASSTDPSLYFNCVNGVAWPQQCPPQFKFNPNFNFDKCLGEICRKSSGGSPPVDGNWSEWSAWSACEPSCGDGLRMRSRLCNNPPPSNGGNDCQGQPSESEPCTNGPCSQGGAAFMVSLTETTNGNAGIMNWTSVNLNSDDMFNQETNDVTIKTAGLYFFSMVATTTSGNVINMATERTGLSIGISRAAYENADGPETMSRSGLFVLTPVFKPQMKLKTPTSLYSTADGRETSWLGFNYKSDSYLFCGSNKRLPTGFVKWPIVSAMKGFRENSILSQFRVELAGLYFINAGMLYGFTHSDYYRIGKLAVQVLRNNELFATPLEFSASIQNRLGTEQFTRSNLVSLQQGDVLTAKVTLPILGASGPLAGVNTETYMGAFKMNEALAYFQATRTDSTCNEFRRVNLKDINDSTASWNATRNEFVVKNEGIYFIEFTFEKYHNSKLDLRMFLNNERVAVSMKHSILGRNTLFSRTLLLSLKENDKIHWENYGCISEQAFVTIIQTS
ncbi:DgyrCDS14961 [Dimorphilus gyrociliatus]|uniref:DgyrCDS14961 n=1 Tax=Dimorphilus gyrociliatus TaxID=2664684 RepID=A0A7I8WFH9_9ANNE|nr:DgyrCDS14961 [Dimorphilus gyrociliatus]